MCEQRANGIEMTSDRNGRVRGMGARWLSLGITCVVAAHLTGCGTPGAVPSPNGDDANGEVAFSARVQPIFTTNCAGCHSAGGIADQSGIALRLVSGESFDLLVNQQSVQNSALTLVIPGDAESSLLFQKISSDNPPVGLRMPRFVAPLSDADVQTIRNWIDQGAPNN